MAPILAGVSAAGIRVSISILLGCVAGLLSTHYLAWQISELIGWNAAASSYLVGVWRRIPGRRPYDSTRQLFARTRAFRPRS